MVRGTQQSTGSIFDASLYGGASLGTECHGDHPTFRPKVPNEGQNCGENPVLRQNRLQ